MSEHEWEEIPRPISGIRDLVCRRCGVNYLDLPDDEVTKADQQLDRAGELDAYDAAYAAASAHAAAEISALEERVRRFEESLALCLGAESPLPPLAKDVVRGFFIATAAKKEVVVLIESREMVPVDDAIEYGECLVCGAEPGQQCSTTDLSEWQPEGPAHISTTELAGWVHPERGE